MDPALTQFGILRKRRNIVGPCGLFVAIAVARDSQRWCRVGVNLARISLRLSFAAMLATCLGLPLLAACGSKPTPIVVPPMDATHALPTTSFYCPDEYLKWTLRWNGIEAASTEMVTGQPGEIGGEPAIIVYSLSHSSELATIFRDVREELSSQISLRTGRPLRNESNISEDGDEESLRIEFASKGYSASLQDDGENKKWQIEGLGLGGDLHTFLARLRMWDGLPASGVLAIVQNGRRHYRVDLARGGTEVIKTPMGEIPTIRIHGQATSLRKDGETLETAEERAFTLWRSDDGRFLPLRFEVETRLGQVRGTLVDARQPETHRCIEVDPN